MIYPLLRMAPALLALAMSVAQTRASTFTWNEQLTQLVTAVSITIWLGAAMACAPKLPKMLAPALVMIGVGALLGCGLIDDAYISLRYARNWSAGHGVVFNVGERVEGYTGFLWVCLLAALKTLVASAALPAVVRWLGVAFSVAAIWIADRTATNLAIGTATSPGGAAASGLPVIMSAHFPLIFWGFSGMETGLYIALLAASAYFFCSYLSEHAARTRALGASASLLALAMLTRPETYLLCLGYLPFVVARERRAASRAMLVFVAILVGVFAPYLSWRYAYYGYLLPNTYYAKVGAPFAHWEDGVDYVFAGCVAHALLIPFAFQGSRTPPTARLPRRFLGTIVLLIVLSVIATGGDTFSEWRYFVYALPLLYALARNQLAEAFRGPARLAATRGWKWLWRSQLLAVVSVGFFLTTFLLAAVGPQTTLSFGAREAERWALVGRWLAQRAKPGDSLATPVIGALGYYSDMRVVDMLGLTDAVIARTPVRNDSAPNGHQRSNPTYVLSRRPTYIYLASDAQDEHAFLNARHWIPAIDDLRRFFPNPDYRFEIHASGKTRHAFYIRRGRAGVPLQKQAEQRSSATRR